MKVTRLEAEKVHGYLPIRVDFFDDLTFLTGLNGSGKTTALRLLMALLTPNFEEFSSIEFTSATATVSDEGRCIAIRADRSPNGVEISITGVGSVLSLSSADLQLLSDARRRDDPRTGRDEPRPVVEEKVISHEVFLAITRISTPMFLGLDRRFFATMPLWQDSNEVRRRDYLNRRLWAEDPSMRSTTAASLADVNYLVTSSMQEIRASQETLDEVLRRKILARAFEYKPSDTTNINQLPSRLELDRYRQRLAHIERAAEGLRLPAPELKATLGLFFERMTLVVDALDKSAQKDSKASKKHRPNPSRELPGRDFLDWIINKPQADRILEHLALLDEYLGKRTLLNEPIERFVSLVNRFLAQTKKRVSVNARGEVSIYLADDDSPRSVTALSSGERQLLVMLAHLSLNKHLAGSGVFIVDEPELSLHIAWQERFVDAIREANPSVQLIMATHSPAIILDRVNNCRSLSDQSG